MYSHIVEKIINRGLNEIGLLRATEIAKNLGKANNA
jgi:hypothetical protein